MHSLSKTQCVRNIKRAATATAPNTRLSFVTRTSPVDTVVRFTKYPNISTFTTCCVQYNVCRCASNCWELKTFPSDSKHVWILEKRKVLSVCFVSPQKCSASAPSGTMTIRTDQQERTDKRTYDESRRQFSSQTTESNLARGRTHKEVATNSWSVSQGLCQSCQSWVCT